MKIKTMNENLVEDIGHAFGYYDYGTEHGTHFAFPESMLRQIIPVFPDIIVSRAFHAAREYPRKVLSCPRRSRYQFFAVNIHRLHAEDGIHLVHANVDGPEQEEII